MTDVLLALALLMCALLFCAGTLLLMAAAFVGANALREFHRARAHAAEADATTVTTTAAVQAINEFDQRERKPNEWTPPSEDELLEAIRAQRPEQPPQRPMTDEEISAYRDAAGLEGEPPIMPVGMYADVSS